MNAMRDLTAGAGCSADGTAASVNPLTGLVNQAMGMGQKGMPAPGAIGPRGMMPGQMNDVDKGMNAGMGLSRGGDARSPFERGPQQFQQGGMPQQNMHHQSPFERGLQSDAMAREFQQQFRGGAPPPNQLLGPRGHAAPAEPWIDDFQRMNLRGGEAFGAPSARAMAWGQDMARGPPPMEMERAWRERNMAQGKAWADDMAKHVPVQAPISAPSQANDPLAQAWDQSAEPNNLEDMFAKAWKDGNLDEAELDNAWKEMMTQAQGQGFDLDSAWESGMWNMPEHAMSPLETQYDLEPNNPYADAANPFDEGLKLFHAGQLHEAVLAFQAVVSKEPAHSEAWRMLGLVHQENDEDKKAILCLERAVEHDAYNLDALMALGVSYVNELDHVNALKNLKSWVVNNPAFVGLEVQQDDYSDGSMMDEVMQLMLKAAEWAPKDAGVHEVLGVLFNVTRDYSSASAAFRKAVDARPDDYSLWNKCGATLANSTPSRSEEAIPAYLRAIELRPGYARAHLNLGISYNNLGNYESAARAYVKALELSPTAMHIWQYLKISCTCMERQDLVALCEARDLEGLKRSF